MRVWLYPGFRRSLANNPWGSSVCIISGSGCCSLLCSCVVPDCSTCLLLASLCYYTYTSIEQTKPKTANERRVVGLCMSSYFQCCVLDQGGLLYFPFLNCCHHSFKMVALFLPHTVTSMYMQMILFCDRDVGLNMFSLPTCQKTKLGLFSFTWWRDTASLGWR